MEPLSPSHNGNPLHQAYGKRRSVRWIACAIVGVLLILFITGQNYSPVPSVSSMRSSGKKAKYITPAELLSRPISKDLQAMPRLVHQSWSSTELPSRMQRWSDSCRKAHPDWEWVLWTDEDNERLVEEHYPWALKTYRSLPAVIFKADMVRLMYMHLFGGMYADLDVECLRPFDEVLDKFNVSTIAHTKPRPQSAHGLTKTGRKAFLGRMGTDHGFDNSIPNAWMASTPGHPFFLLVIEHIIKAFSENAGHLPTEAVAGPMRLFWSVGEYLRPDGEYAGELLDDHMRKNPSAKQFAPRPGLPHSVDVLPFQYVYPYSWQRDGQFVRSTCWATSEAFDAERCKALLATDLWPSYFITYWSHTWAGAGHNEENVQKMHSLEGLGD